MEIREASEQEATRVIETLEAAGYAHIEGLRKNFEYLVEVFEEDLFNGNWDSTTDFEPGTPNLRIIQEDEYDQSMDDDEVEELKDRQLGYSGYYIFSV